MNHRIDECSACLDVTIGRLPKERKSKTKKRYHQNMSFSGLDQEMQQDFSAKGQQCHTS